MQLLKNDLVFLYNMFSYNNSQSLSA